MKIYRARTVDFSGVTLMVYLVRARSKRRAREIVESIDKSNDGMYVNRVRGEVVCQWVEPS
jgi:hypothetical protein